MNILNVLFTQSKLNVIISFILFYFILLCWPFALDMEKPLVSVHRY